MLFSRNNFQVRKFLVFPHCVTKVIRKCNYNTYLSYFTVSRTFSIMPPKKRAQTEDKNGASNGATSPKLNKTSSDYDSLDFEVTKKSKEGKNHNFKITSWNVDGLRAWIKKGGLDFVKYEKPDVLCLQEIKCSEEKLPPEIKVSF